MCLFIESIRIEGRSFRNMEYHAERMERTMADHFGHGQGFKLAEAVRVPEGLGDGVYKFRILYDTEIREIRCEPYERKAVRRLRLVDAGGFRYAYKYADRSGLERLYSLRGGCDDIIIVRGGLVTDASLANLVFENRHGFFTPEEPFLGGVRRRELMEKGIVRARRIEVGDIREFERVHLVNAMVGLGESVVQVDRVETG